MNWIKKLFTRKQITVADFDNAVKQTWSTRTCLLAQAGQRLQLPGINAGPEIAATQLANDNTKADALMSMFDKHFQQPGDERTSLELSCLRQLLPIDL